MYLEGTVSQTHLLKTSSPLFGKYLQFNCVTFGQTGEFSNPRNSEMRKYVRQESKGLKSGAMFNNATRET
jgi:hypothetical protein